MQLRRLTLSAIAVFSVYVFFASLAHAQATRTWVSGVGDDANPCSRTAPCKTFPGAISKTAAGGEINCLDPGGFGVVTITKAITIDCLHTVGGVLAAGGTNGVNVHAGGSDRIILRGLDINGVGSGLTGIVLTSGGSLHVEDSVISGMQNGINIAAGNEVYIKNTYIRNNSNIGVLISSGGAVNVVIEKTTVENQTHGLYAGPNARVITRGSVYSGHSNIGILALGGGSGADVNVDDCIVSNNGVGLYSSGAQAIIRAAASVITGNNAGVTADGSGIVATYSDNKLQGNTWDGGFNLALTTN